MEKILNFIGGEFRPPRSGEFFEKDEPAKGKPYLLVPDSDERDVADAVAAAKAAAPAWAAMPTERRSRILNKLADLLERDGEELARAESRDNGKPISLSRAVDAPRGAANFRFFAAGAVAFHGESFVTDTRALNYTEYQPVGVVATISPWNLPLLSLTWKIAPALATGNAVIAKPSEVTPMTAHLLCERAREAGLPPGVLNVVHGTGPKAGGPLTMHPDVRAISFTGSTATGRRIAESTAGSFKKLSLEMGGKNANVVFADCDFEKAIEGTLRSSFLNQGQVCLCGSRILVERAIYEKFRDALVARAKAMRVGDPFDEKTEQGALVSRAHREKVVACLKIARDEGGKFLCGGEAVKPAGDCADGFFLAPTLIEGLGPATRTNQEEIFGPVATLAPFDTEEEALAIANDVRYGLSASVWTTNVARATRVSRRLECGIVWVNTWNFRDLRTPFGGIKESGVGREGGMEALRFFTEVKNVCLATE